MQTRKGAHKIVLATNCSFAYVESFSISFVFLHTSINLLIPCWALMQSCPASAP
uniref:Uncharacterized protein n=1 Tax=Anguilla anguilla TaxID=7936 RepID=A0A0E9WBH2_ANGAN